MAKVVCKCGATGYSKCPHCRTVFPDNQADAVLSHILKWKVEGEKVVITASLFPTEAGSIAGALQGLYFLLDNMATGKHDYPSFEQYSCNHKWEFAPGEKSDISCGC